MTGDRCRSRHAAGISPLRKPRTSAAALRPGHPPKNAIEAPTCFVRSHRNWQSIRDTLAVTAQERRYDQLDKTSLSLSSRPDLQDQSRTTSSSAAGTGRPIVRPTPTRRRCRSRISSRSTADGYRLPTTRRPAAARRSRTRPPPSSARRPPARWSGRSRRRAWRRVRF